jgi:hypothetical protein
MRHDEAVRAIDRSPRTAATICLMLFTALASPATAESAIEVLAGPAPSQSVGGAIAEPIADDLSEAARADIQARLTRAAARLAERGRAEQGLAVQPRFSWPVQDPGLDGFSYYGISNYVDHDPAYPDRVRDYQCGDHTYDTAGGYNHAGVDIFLWPWPWNKMDSGEVQVIAAAEGVIVEKDDGHPDRSCALSDKPWNAVYVQHADGSTAWYGHLKRGSLTAKAIGEPVARGEILGTVGSSGSSTGPHLHFEVHDAHGGLVDPYAGPCNAIAASWWQTQPPYVDPAIDDITTGAAAPDLGTCPNSAKPNRQDVLVQGRKAFFTGYYRDQLAGAVSLHTLYTPSNAIYARWSQSSPDSYAASYWYFTYDHFAADAPLGLWHYEIEFAGRLYERGFEVVAAPRDVPTSTRIPTRTPSGQITRTPTPPAGACAGDCGADGHVAVDELVRAVNVALGAAAIDSCRAADGNADGTVTIAELIAAVANALDDCAAAR